MHINEIRDYLERSPRKWLYRDGRMVNTTFVRLKWLATLAQGTLNERINRRAGITDPYIPWKNATYSACRRRHRKELKRRGLKYYGH